MAALEQTSVTMEVRAQLIATTPQGGSEDREEREEPGKYTLILPFYHANIKLTNPV